GVGGPAGAGIDAKVEREQVVSPDGEGRLGGDGNGAAAGCGVPAAKGFFDSGAVVRSRWACGTGVRDSVQRFMEEVRMKAMKKEKLFTRNFTLLILGQVSSLTGN